MNAQLQQILQEILALAQEGKVEAVLDAHDQLLKLATKDDLAPLLAALESIQNDFWLRELIAEPITYIGDPSALPMLIQAYDQNLQEGHDNDGFSLFMTAMIEGSPIIFGQKLTELLATDNYPHQETASWLLEWCAS